MTDGYICPACNKEPADTRIDGNYLCSSCAGDFIASRSRALDYSNKHR